MQRWFLAREETEVGGGEGECDGVGEGAVREGGELGCYCAVEAVVGGFLVSWYWAGGKGRDILER